MYVIVYTPPLSYVFHFTCLNEETTTLEVDNRVDEIVINMSHSY